MVFRFFIFPILFSFLALRSMAAPAVVKSLNGVEDLNWALQNIYQSHTVAMGDRVSPYYVVSQSILHRERVKRLFLYAMEVEGYAKDFGRDFLLSYIELHDFPKIMRGSQLKDYGYEGSPFYRRLARYWGLKRGELKPQQEKAVDAIIAEMNEVEDRIKHEFFMEQRELGNIPVDGVSMHKLKQIVKRIEHIVDLVDAGLGRREELGNKIDLASDRFKRQGNDNAHRLALKLETNYESAVFEILQLKRQARRMPRPFCLDYFLF